jgi:hypothetical protein
VFRKIINQKSGMITRMWHGRTSIEKAEAYLLFLQQKGIKDYLKTPGNISVKIWRQFDNNCCHFYTITEWDELSSIIAFAGNDISKAVYYPEDNDFLLEFEEFVRHFETAVMK